MIKDAEQAHRRLIRGGSVIMACFDYDMKYEYSELPAQHAMKLTDTYGLSLGDIIIIAASHGMAVDEKGYEKLLAEKEVAQKCMKPKHAKPRKV